MKKLALIIILLLSFKNTYVQDFDESLGYSGKYLEFSKKDFDQVKKGYIDFFNKEFSCVAKLINIKNFDILKRFYSISFSKHIIGTEKLKTYVILPHINSSIFYLAFFSFTKKEAHYILFGLNLNSKDADEFLNEDDELNLKEKIVGLEHRIECEKSNIHSKL